MLEKVKKFAQLEITEDGTIFLKELNQIMEDGQVISSIPHRTVYTPDADETTLPDLVKPYAQLTWTTAVKNAYKAKQK